MTTNKAELTEREQIEDILEQFQVRPFGYVFKPYVRERYAAELLVKLHKFFKNIPEDRLFDK